MSKYNSLREAYPEIAPDYFSQDDYEQMQTFLQPTVSEWVQRLEEGLEVHNRPNGKQLRVYVDRGTSDKIVLVGAEHANGYWDMANPNLPNSAFTRAQVARKFIDPEATLIYAGANTIKDRDNITLDARDKRQLLRGDIAPITDGWRVVLDKVQRERGTDKTLLIGMSLGTVGTADVLGKEADRINGALFLEAPNVSDRPIFDLTKFLWSGKKLRDNLSLNGSDQDTEIVKAHLDSLNSNFGYIKFLAGLALTSNVAMLPAMVRDTISPAIGRALSTETSVVHAWGTRAGISPLADNRRIQDQYTDDPNYKSFEFQGPLADHMLSNAYPVVAALSRVVASRSGD